MDQQDAWSLLAPDPSTFPMRRRPTRSGIMKRLMMTTILMLATTSTFSLAQAPADHDAHHPPQATSPAPAQPAPPPGQPGMGGMPMMNMMSGMMNDMSMMSMMETMRSMRMMGPDGGGMATIDRI
jgi:predicted lipid-binding transport protein (Tim44 family)